MEPYAVTVHRFAAFVAATGHVTEAELGNVWEWTADGVQCGGSSGRSAGDAPMGHVGFRVVSAAWSNGSLATVA